MNRSPLGWLYRGQIVHEHPPGDRIFCDCRAQHHDVALRQEAMGGARGAFPQLDQTRMIGALRRAYS